jgi:hypothetical protein
MNATIHYPAFSTDLLGDNLTLIATCARFAGFTLPLDPIEAGRQIVSELSLTFADVRRMTESDCRRTARIWVSIRSGNNA